MEKPVMTDYEIIKGLDDNEWFLIEKDSDKQVFFGTLSDIRAWLEFNSLDMLIT